MDHDHAASLLAHRSLVASTAPWCTTLDNLELAVLLLAVPWIGGTRLRRADLERRLAALGPDMPVGPVYFQRVNRAVAALESAGALRGSGTGRTRRFTTSPEGFVALMLNLRHLQADPTIDASEFEFKRALVAMWNVMLGHALDLASDFRRTGDVERFFEQVEAVRFGGRAVVTSETIAEALDLLGLVESQRSRVAQRRDSAVRDLDSALAAGEWIGPAQTAFRASVLLESNITVRADGAIERLEALAASTLPALRSRAALVRYDAYLAYLDGLTALYSRQAQVADLGRLRTMLGTTPARDRVPRAPRPTKAARTR